ncbi:MAG: hypothetical protein ABIQ16_09935 [Polyangiaceae bacterium]
MRTALVLSAASLLGVLLVGCDKKETPRDSEDESAADGGKGKSRPSKAATDEPDLAQAMENVAADRAPTMGGTAGGPPPSGIFAPGEADKAAAKGSAATFALGGEGSEPRVLLGPGPKPGSKRSGTVELATQSDPQQGAIPIQFTVTVEAQKPKAEGDAGVSLTTVVTKVTGAKVNAPGVPAELLAAVGKLKGSSVQYQVGADGVAANVHSEIPKGVDPGFRDPVQALSDLLVGLALPYPTKPVGVGAFWMVTTRDVVMGLDVVSYRLVKVEKVEGNVVSLSLNTKRYAASASFELEGLPPDAPKTMSEFRAQSEGKLTLAAGDPFPKSSEVQALVAAALGPADSKQRPMVQVQTRASLSLAP